MSRTQPDAARPWSWLPPRPWTCPRCTATIDTREAAPRCERCGFVEGS